MSDPPIECQIKDEPLFERHYKIVSKRYDSFLIATAFLVTAYATVIVVCYDKHSFDPNLLHLADAISAIGLYLAFFFAVANFHGSLLIKYEQLLPAYKGMCKNNYWPKNPCGLGCKFFCHIFRAVFRPGIDIQCPNNDFELKNPAYIHTWLIPLLLLLFWLVVPFFVLPHTPNHWWWILAILAASPFVLLLLIWAISTIIRKCFDC